LIEAIGFDLVEVSRIEEAILRPGFRERILTPREREINEGARFLAGRWAAKEAIAKAVGVHLTWQQVEVLNDPSGKPLVTVEGLGPEFRVHLSISHERGHAAAVAVLERV
jgi:holo-[acyl-carrier protein] synthase